MKRLLVCFCTLSALMLGPATAAHAEFGLATLLSSAPPLQFEVAGSPAFSQNGEYVAFRGSLAGVPGIYRRDLHTGQVQLVAGASPEAELDAPDAAAPSISAEGRYVAFTTSHDLDAADANDLSSGCPEVYVRDMNAPLIPDAKVDAKPFTLASAINGGSEGLAYQTNCGEPSEGDLALAGAQAAPGVALSANGEEVAFTVLSPSNLTGSCEGTPLKCPTEPSQVAIRNLQTLTTTVVSTTPGGQPTPGGGSFPSVESENRLGGEADRLIAGETASSAAISAEGNAVAWQGTNVPAQVPASTEEITSGMKSLGASLGLEVEPLWREIAAGHAAVTKRLLAGQSQGLNFYFHESHEGTDNAIEGGAVAPARSTPDPPALSANGHIVATISNAPTAANQGSYRYVGSSLPPPTEAYVAHVEDLEGVPAEITQLTATPDFAATNAIFGGVADLAISPNGQLTAFNSRRVAFALAPPTLVSPPAPEAPYSYTYEANLAAGTLQRVTSTYDGAPPDGEPGQLSFGADGRLIAFASSAGNLFYGDATPGVSQVLMTEELLSEEMPPPQSESTPPALPPVLPSWLLSATVVPERDGSVLIYAEVPGAGRLEARAIAQLPAFGSQRGRAANRKPGKKGRTRAGGAKSSPRARIVSTLVASGHKAAAGASQLQLRLRPGVRYSARVASKEGFYAVISVSFSAPGHRVVRQHLPVTFHLAGTTKTEPHGHRKESKR